MQNVEEVIKAVASQGGKVEQKAEEKMQIVIFELDGEEYAVEIADLQEIIKLPEITPVPNAPQFISGIFNLRGKIVVVVDLEKRFNLARENEKKEENIIIAQVESNLFGVIVDRVAEIKNVPVKNLQTAPLLAAAKIQTDYLKGVIVLEEEKQADGNLDAAGKDETVSRLIILLDLPRLLKENELLSLGKKVDEILATN